MEGRKIEWTTRALKDKINIFQYWITTNKSSTYVKRLEILFNKAILLSAKFPLGGVPTEIQNVRFTLIRHYKIYYRITPDTIEILAIWDSRRNPKSFKF